MKNKGFPALAFLFLLSLACSLSEPTPVPIGPAPTASLPEPSSSARPGGSYQVTGTGLDGSSYEGSLYIEEWGEVYWLEWEVGGASYTGTGILTGDVLSVGWDAGGTCGVVSYRVLPDGSLEGTWSVCGEDRVGWERAVPLRSGPSAEGRGVLRPL